MGRKAWRHWHPSGKMGAAGAHTGYQGGTRMGYRRRCACAGKEEAWEEAGYVEDRLIFACCAPHLRDKCRVSNLPVFLRLQLGYSFLLYECFVYGRVDDVVIVNLP